MAIAGSGTLRDETGFEALLDAVLGASRALVAVAARSLVDVADDVTLVQYRVLVELAASGPQRLADLANGLGVDPSTATRMCDRLVRKGLVLRRRATADRRAVRVSLAPSGRDLVTEVTRRRRAQLATILERLPDEDRRPVLAALRAFASAAGEVPEREWSLGWHLDLPVAPLKAKHG
ncbi:MAG TPA: MarR family winged helix-turn-helix transcriptional regulator [Acidimicrobiales bacterium]|nr:MarR family winged helix-turn-helix transcriptional regulator [Acidimicrobiales bacterium]